LPLKDNYLVLNMAAFSCIICSWDLFSCYSAWLSSLFSPLLLIQSFIEGGKETFFFRQQNFKFI